VKEAGGAGSQPAWFGTTHWTVVLTAAETPSPEADAALESLCRAYWYPLYAHVRRRGFDSHTAQDLTQSFFERLLEKRFLRSADPTRGKFRSFLLACLGHFLANEWRNGHTLKRGGGGVPLALDLDGAEALYALEAEGVSPERLFDWRWAQGILDRAASNLRQEFSAADRGRVFDELNRFLSLPSANGEYDAAAEKLELAPSTVAWTVHRMRQRFAELARQEIAQTVSTPLEVEEETRYLLEVIKAAM
jgi:DNA-directed RNA polymerase specialized sigma24 family protein